MPKPVTHPTKSNPENATPDAANSYERSRPKDQSPSGALDQSKPPVLEKQDSQDQQNEAPDEPPQSRRHKPAQDAQKT